MNVAVEVRQQMHWIKQIKRDRQEAVCANSGEICYHVIFKHDLFFKHLWEKAISVAFTM